MNHSDGLHPFGFRKKRDGGVPVDARVVDQTVFIFSHFNKSWFGVASGIRISRPHQVEKHIHYARAALQRVPPCRKVYEGLTYRALSR